MTKKPARPKVSPMDRAIDEALHQAARDAVESHKAAGLPLVGSKNGHVVWVQPDDLPVQEAKKPSRSRSRKRRSA